MECALAMERVLDGFTAAWLAVFVLGTATVFRGQAELVIPRPCMESVALSDDSECHGPDKQHLSCTGLVLTVRAACGELRVTP
jgi:hypothetical protein